MQPQLVDTEPDYAFQASDGWVFQFGEKVIGKRFGQVFLTTPTSSYRVFKVIPGETGLPKPVLETKRELKPEELAHFTKLAKEAERELKRAETRERRSKLTQQQNAISDATGGRVLQ